MQNLPLGVFSPRGQAARIGTAIGDWLLDLNAIADNLPQAVRPALREPSLNALFALPKTERLGLRHALFGLLTDFRAQKHVGEHLYQTEDCQMQLPAVIGDYTDFYAGIHHATNVGKLFRPDNPLLPNYRHVPIGYHGRSSSIRCSGARLVRPSGQRKAADCLRPSYGPTAQLDFEAELGIWICGENSLGKPVPISRAADRIAGLCLLNDWSARDIQAWEYQPLGPFLAKNFLTTISPWVITAEALAPFRRAQTPRAFADPAPLPYLWDEQDQALGAFAIRFDASIRTNAMRKTGGDYFRLSCGDAADMYWTASQLVTHHSSGGCDLRPGDLFGTGTISGEDESAFGSLLELSRGGTAPVSLPNGEQRSFLVDGDELRLSGYAEAPGRRRIGFGECVGLVEPAHGPR